MTYKAEYLSPKEMDKKFNAITDATIKCKCSHSVVMPNADRTICSHCGSWVYRTKAIEFKYKMKEAMLRSKK
jgi:Zn finger protein HypA/HybF involved in hydrogenase expression